MENAYSKERKVRKQTQLDFNDLKARLDTLEETEAKLKKWEDRKPMINHYLAVVGVMAK